MKYALQRTGFALGISVAALPVTRAVIDRWRFPPDRRVPMQRRQGGEVFEWHSADAKIVQGNLVAVLGWGRTDRVNQTRPIAMPL